MCGLTGYIGIEPISKLELDFLMVSNLKRGRDSAGYYDANTRAIRKSLGDVDDNLLLDFPITPTTGFIGHCRASTAYGTAKDADSAHPFTFKGIVLAHNGTIDNLYALKTAVPFKNTESLMDTCEVDSKYIAWRMSVDKDFQPILQSYSGKAALIWVPILNNKRNIMFTYHDNERPLFTGINPNTGGRVFHSLESALKTIGCTDIYSLPIHTVTEWNSEGGIVKETIIDRTNPLTTYKNVHTNNNRSTYNDNLNSSDPDIFKYVDKAKAYIKDKKYNKNAVESAYSSKFNTFKGIQEIILKDIKEIVTSKAAQSIDFVIKDTKNVLLNTNYNLLKVDNFNITQIQQDLYVVFDEMGFQYLPDEHEIDKFIKIDNNKRSDIYKKLIDKKSTYSLSDAYSLLAYHFSDKASFENPNAVCLKNRRLYTINSAVYYSAKDPLTRYVDLQEVGTDNSIKSVNIKYLRTLSYSTPAVVETFLNYLNLKATDTKLNAVSATEVNYALDAHSKAIAKDTNVVLSLAAIAAYCMNSESTYQLVHYDYENINKKDYARDFITAETKIKYKLIEVLISDYCANLNGEYGLDNLPYDYTITQCLINGSDPQKSTLSVNVYMSTLLKSKTINVKSNDVYNAKYVGTNDLIFDESLSVINDPISLTDTALVKIFKILVIQSVIENKDLLTPFQNTLIGLGRKPGKESEITPYNSKEVGDLEFNARNTNSNSNNIDEDPVNEQSFEETDEALEDIIDQITQIETCALECMILASNINSIPTKVVVEHCLTNIKLSASSALEDIQEEKSKDRVFS